MKWALLLLTLCLVACSHTPTSILEKHLGKTKQGSKEEQAEDIGKAEGRAEVLNNLWKQQAINGVPLTGNNSGNTGTPTYRRVWVPERNVNGVTYPAGYQVVPYYR